jgi:hypothetical protein
MRPRLTLAALIGALALWGCSDDTRAPTEPRAQLDKGVPCPTTVFPLDQANEQIRGLYSADGGKKSPQAVALAKAKDISEKWSKCKVADPQSKVVAFVSQLLTDFRAEALTGGLSSETAAKVSQLINTMYSGVGFGTPNLPVDPNTGTDFGVGFFTPGTPLLVRSNQGDIAVSLQADAFTETTAITVFLRPDDPNPFEGTGRTVIPPYVEIIASNLSGTHYLANGQAVVGFCVDDEDVLHQFSDPAIAHLAVAEGSHAGGFEVLPNVSSAQYLALGLSCDQYIPPSPIIGSLFQGGLRGFAAAAPHVMAHLARAAAAAVFMPDRLEATLGQAKGLGGLATSLSPFGVTDRIGVFTPTTLTVTSEPYGATVTRTVHLSNENGAPVANVPVTFAATAGTLAGSQPVLTNASGDATVSWTLPGTAQVDTLTASITDPGFTPSSVSFTVAEASSDGQLTSLGCNAEGTITSTSGDTPTEIVFENQTAIDLSINWLDYTGARVFYQTLLAESSYTQPTYVTHPWIVVSNDGVTETCWGIYVPFSAPAPPGTAGRVVVSPPITLF